MIFSKITNKTVLGFVTLAEAKRQLNIIDDTSDDLHITDVLNTAMELAEKATKRMLSESTITLSVKGRCQFFVPYGEVDAITSVQVDGEDIAFNFSSVTQLLTITEPTVTDDTEIIVIYQAGYKTVNDVPHAVKMGVKMMLSTLYENREDDVVGTIVTSVPTGSQTLFESCMLEYSI